ncbi:hypothetical protein PBRA_003479 [Plasmodiophora brassicae]|uniref:FYVE-type domain-containing protein n=1 Tax=Plasmodiophora brassicae TaxID=37360 RepID=A0A0G4J928_PLABS|nr:hypothetical protein PBRA_003479 [Plasmodiophora brassicae]
MGAANCTGRAGERRRFGLVDIEWTPNAYCKNCELCGLRLRRGRRHHCRSCGRLTCPSCSPRRRPLPQLGLGSHAAHRVCFRCDTKAVNLVDLETTLHSECVSLSRHTSLDAAVGICRTLQQASLHVKFNERLRDWVAARVSTIVVRDLVPVQHALLVRHASGRRVGSIVLDTMALLAACSILQIDQEPSVATLKAQCQNAQSLAIVQAGGLRAALHGDPRCLSSFMAKRGILAQCRTSRATTTRPAGVD